MPRMMRSSLIGALRQSIVSTVAPSRSTVIESATLAISLSLCEMRIDAMPWRFSSSSSASSASLSFSFRLAVGSSRISSFTSFASALAISTSCCLPTPRSVTSVVGGSFRPTLASSSRVFA
ncbi:hypothetical protein D9M68_323490 [compost metagenome]